MHCKNKHQDGYNTEINDVVAVGDYDDDDDGDDGDNDGDDIDENGDADDVFYYIGDDDDDVDKIYRNAHIKKILNHDYQFLYL